LARLIVPNKQNKEVKEYIKIDRLDIFNMFRVDALVETLYVYAKKMNHEKTLVTN